MRSQMGPEDDIWPRGYVCNRHRLHTALGRTAFGRISLLVGGNVIGDSSDGNDLLMALGRLVHPVILPGRIYDHLFADLSAKELIDRFWQTRFGDDVDDSVTFRTYSKLVYWVVLSSYDLEGFESVFVVVLQQPPGQIKVVWRRKHDSVTSSATVAESDYKSTVVECYRWLSRAADVTDSYFEWLQTSTEVRQQIRASICTKSPRMRLPENEVELLTEELSSFSRTYRGKKWP